MLLLDVGVAIAYDAFFAEHTELKVYKVLDADLNFFS